MSIDLSKDGSSFVHHVFFYLKNPDNASAAEQLIDGLKKLTQVPTIQYYHIGLPAPTDRDVILGDYSISWLCLFKNLEEEEIYQSHPIHLKFIEECAHLWEKVEVFDSI
ncbi:Dabb family protein [Rhizosphaericola mali]|uniref:Dabb family protein n=1 Tax=Rhizosphaericola mali TaxID=2545455 RepID=A0A5P2G1Z3_9BACT|nr:Dabb family protein [Rhizosphaericola mali]QES89475.1 Dabb family protein [Rhizosphaericola mali]